MKLIQHLTLLLLFTLGATMLHAQEAEATKPDKKKHKKPKTEKVDTAQDQPEVTDSTKADKKVPKKVS